MAADLLNEMAICAMETDRLPEGQAQLIKALTLAPNDTKILSNLGVCCLKMHRLHDARDYFLQVIDHNADDKIAQKYLKEIEQQLSS